MFGFLNIHKPKGKTSRDAVNHIQRMVRPIKVGHGGTLDPLATGVLVVAIGPATRLIEYVQAQPKTYRGTFRLGESSNTEDLEGEIKVLTEPPIPSRQDIERVRPTFVGSIRQIPPAYSAIKIDGKRAYKLARQGSELELSARTIEIYDLEVLSYEYPHLELEIRCGSGTYIRSLGRDFANALGTEAVMTSLVRTSIGDFRLEDALNLESLQPEALAPSLIQPDRALASHATITLDPTQLRQLQNGRPVGLPQISQNESSGPLAFDEQHRLQAILRPTERGWRVAKSFWDAHGTPPEKQVDPRSNIASEDSHTSNQTDL